MPAVPLPPESLPPVAPAPEEALQPVMPNEGSGAVVPSHGGAALPTSVTASPAPPPSPADPSAGGAPPPESPLAAARGRRFGGRAGSAGRQARPSSESTGDYHRSRADDERATPGKQPTRSHSARPREHPDLDPGGEPWGQRGRHAGQRRGHRSPRQLGSDPAIHDPTLSEARRNRAISVVISPGTRSTGPPTIGLRITQPANGRGVHRLPAVAATSHCLPACV